MRKRKRFPACEHSGKHAEKTSWNLQQPLRTGPARQEPWGDSLVFFNPCSEALHTDGTTQAHGQVAISVSLSGGMRAGLIYLVFLQHISNNVSAYASYLSIAAAPASSLVISIKEPANRAGLLHTPPQTPLPVFHETIARQSFPDKDSTVYSD